jgi:hypothetical protein
MGNLVHLQILKSERVTSDGLLRSEIYDKFQDFEFCM